MDLNDSIKHLIESRVSQIHHRFDSYNWIARDPVVGFTAPIIWYLKRNKREAIDDHFDLGKEKYWLNVAQFTVLRDRLRRVLDTLKPARVPVIVLKGALLGETVYENPGMRSMNDLDLLVPSDDLSIVLRHIEQTGWKPQLTQDLPKILKSPGHFPGKDAGQVAEIVYHDLKGYFIDIHWHLIPSIWLRQVYSVDMKAVWKESVPVSDGSLQGAFSLSAVHTLVYLCLHLAQHGLQPIRALLDIDQFVRQCDTLPGWCWEHFVACVREWRMRSAVFHVLNFSKSLFGTPVPKHMIDRLNPGTAARARVSALIRPRDLVVHPPSAAGVRFPALVKAALADRITDMMRLIVQIAVPNANWRKQRYIFGASLRQHWRHVWDVAIRGD